MPCRLVAQADPGATAPGPEWLRSAASGGSVRLALAGVPFNVVFRSAPEAVDCLAQVLHGWPVRVVPDNTAEPRIEIAPDGAGYRTMASWQDEPLCEGSAVSTVCSLLVDLVQGLVGADPNLLCLHCGAVCLDGRLVVFTGPNRAGKSTLVARLAATGATVFCDDLLPIAGPEDHGRALGVKSRLRLPLPRGTAPGFRRFIADNAGPSDGRYLYVNAPDLAPHGASAPIGAVVLLDRQPGVMAHFSPAGQAEALKHLVQRNLARGEAAETIIDRLHRLMSQAECLRLVYSDLEEAAALVVETFGRWPAGRLAISPGLTRLDSMYEAAEQATEPAPLASGTAYRRHPAVAVREVEGELFLAAPGGEAILHLNMLGAGLWNLLAEPISPAEATDLLAIAFPDVARTTLAADVENLFTELAAQNLIVALAVEL